MIDDPQRVLVVAGAAVDEEQLGRELDLDEDDELKVIAPDSLLEIEDALVNFEAGQIVLVAGAPDDAAWSEPDLAEEIRDRFGLPVREMRS